MCEDLQENPINKMKFHEEIYQFIKQFKGQIIGLHFKYLLNTKTMFKNRVGHDLKSTNYGEHFTFCNPELTSETCACLCYANHRDEARKLILIYNKTCSQYQKKINKQIIVLQNKLLTFYFELKLQVRRMENISLAEICRQLASCCAC